MAKTYGWMMFCVAERLPEEFQQTPLENYYSQLVADMIDSQLAANAARNDSMTKSEIAAAMQMAHDQSVGRKLACEKVRQDH